MRTKVVVVAGVALALALAVSGGVAWANWQSTGSAVTSGTAGSVVALQASGAPTSGALLYPGAQLGLAVTITNPNPFPVQVSALDRGTGSTGVDPPHLAAGCAHSGVSLAEATYAVAWTVGPKSTAVFEIGRGLRMTNDSDSACQGASFTVPLAVVGVARP